MQKLPYQTGGRVALTIIITIIIIIIIIIILLLLLLLLVKNYISSSQHCKYLDDSNLYIISEKKCRE